LSSNLGILLKSIRWPNLLITLLTLSISQYLLIKPINSELGIDFNLNLMDFVLLGLSVVFIMAGGYIINDYFDIETDLENKRFNMTALIGKNKTKLIYIALTLSGLLYGLWLVIKLDAIGLYSVHLFSVLLLLLYSRSLKSTPLAGNLIVAILCGIIPILPLLFENESIKNLFHPSYFILIFLAFFAFLSTLIRELVKDMEDVEGDKKTGKMTLPVVMGMKSSRALTILFFSMLIVLIISVIYFMNRHDLISISYLSFGLLLPSMLLFVTLIRKNNKADYHLISKRLKGLMIIGLSYGILYHYIYL